MADDKKDLVVTIAGCGGSGGVPGMGNHWGVCDPENPKNRRTCNSIFIEKGDTYLLVDTGPDVRTHINAISTKKEAQGLEPIRHLDAVFITHIHPDHHVGLYMLRSYLYFMSKAVKLITHSETEKELKTAYPYLFRSAKDYPCVFDHELVEEGSMKIRGIDVEIFMMDHGNCKTHGYIFDKKVAYCTDVIHIPEMWLNKMRDYKMDAFIVEMTDYKEIPFHSHLEKSLAWAEHVDAKNTYFTDLRKNSDYDTLNGITPDNVHPAYDGLEIRCKA